MVKRTLCGAVFAAAVVVAAPASAQTVPGIGPEPSAGAAEMVRLLGDYRQSLGLPRLRASARLTAEAQWYAHDVAAGARGQLVDVVRAGQRVVALAAVD